MIRKFLSFLSLALSVVLFSCSSDNSGAADTPAAATITATINGQSWRSMPGGAVSTVTGFGMFGENQTILTITGMKMDMSAVTIMIPANNLYEDTFTYDENSTAVLGYVNEENSYTSNTSGGSFTLSITNFNAQTGTLSGTFSGTVLDFNGNSISISNGEFNNLSIMTNNFYSNGTMSLSRNGGTSFTMDNNTEDGKFITIIQDDETDQIILNGNNVNLTNEAGIYAVGFPKNVTPGTYNLMTTSGFTAGIGNSENEAEYNLTSGTISITSHNANNVVGTFSFTVSNGTQTVTITDGSFNVTHN